MDIEQKIALEIFYKKLLKISHDEKVFLKDRLACAYTAGCIKPGLNMEHGAMIDTVMYNVIQGKQLIEEYNAGVLLHVNT